MTTRLDVIKRGLQKLRKLGIGREPAAEDERTVGQELDDLYARLRGKGLTNNGTGVWDLTDVPGEIAAPLVVMTASACADDFHIPEDRLVRLQLQSVEAENEIRRQTARLNDRKPVVVEQF